MAADFYRFVSFIEQIGNIGFGKALDANQMAMGKEDHAHVLLEFVREKWKPVFRQDKRQRKALEPLCL
ncbi:hypothetical protein RvVAR031_16580 [Agrobacterium vitis]|nr:hypothetical protein RvVAR031_16580 [Agrobacterium vitis]